MRPIPIEAAKTISKTYDYDHVIIFGWNRQHNTQHVTTYGRTLIDCDQVAQGGNMLKAKLLNWPSELCGIEPNRVLKLRAEIEILKARVKELEGTL